MLPERLQPFADQPIKVLDDGHVLLVDVLGDEQTIINAARVSYGTGTKRVSEDRHLIRYLLRHSHTTPFEMCEIILRVRVPMDCWRQWIRHRTASVNEYSTRYSEAIDSCQKTPSDGWRAQATTNKQGSSGLVTEWTEPFEGTERSMAGSPGEYLSYREQKLHVLAREVYEERIALGVAREVARKDLPLSTYTEAYWKCDLHNLLHFLSLRLDTHAQKEIREYAEAIAQIVAAWVPWVWEAFNDYNFRRQAVLFSRQEVAGLKKMLRGLIRERTTNGPSFEDACGDALGDALKGTGFGKGRETEEFTAKLRLLLKE